MKSKFILAFFLVVATNFAAVNFANAAELDKPAEICSLINETIILSTPCKVDTANRVISFEIKLTIRRAGMLCGSIKRIAYANGWALPFDWKIQIQSTDVNGMPIAECAYRSTDLFG